VVVCCTFSYLHFARLHFGTPPPLLERAQQTIFSSIPPPHTINKFKIKRKCGSKPYLLARTTYIRIRNTHTIERKEYIHSCLIREGSHTYHTNQPPGRKESKKSQIAAPSTPTPFSHLHFRTFVLCRLPTLLSSSLPLFFLKLAHPCH
jgi:hypothetical protein